MPKATRALRKVKVLLSSRNKDRIPDGAGGALPLLEVRRALQQQLGAELFCGEPLLEVWINEEAGAQDGTADVWQHCLDETDRADVVVAIYNGEAGWSGTTGGVGICHAEVDHVLQVAPAKLRLIRLDFPSDAGLKLTSPAEAAKAGAANPRFAEALERSGRWTALASDRPSLEREVRRAVANAVADYVETAAREGRRGRFYVGLPLDWSRLGYKERKAEIEQTVRRHLVLLGAEERADGVVLARAGRRLLLRVHGVPDGLGTAEAREMVGRPYLFDHQSAVVSRADAEGPAHLVVCHKSCTERQVAAFIGHPDVYLVSPPFGFFVADPASFAQAFFLKNCRDPNSTRFAVESLLRWIDEAGEMPRILARAASRAVIARATAREVEAHSPQPGASPATPRGRRAR